MAKPNTSKMIRDTETIVEQVGGVFLLGHQYVRPHVETCQRKLYQSIDLLTTAEPILISARLEALETDYHDAGHTINLQRFRRLHVFLTLIAVPFVVLVQRLRLLELLQALV